MWNWRISHLSFKRKYTIKVFGSFHNKDVLLYFFYSFYIFWSELFLFALFLFSNRMFVSKLFAELTAIKFSLLVSLPHNQRSDCFVSNVFLRYLLHINGTGRFFPLFPFRFATSEAKTPNLSWMVKKTFFLEDIFFYFFLYCSMRSIENERWVLRDKS